MSIATELQRIIQAKADIKAALVSKGCPVLSSETIDDYAKYINAMGKYHEYVEIGGIKWATMNIGADSITDGGLFFQWGDTKGYIAAQIGSGSGQKYFDWTDYKYNPSGDGSTMTKYNSTDGKTVLEASDDAVTAAWGGKWRMPTVSEFIALGDAATTAWTADYQGSGVAGLVCTDKTDSSKVLFFPAAGFCFNDSVDYVGGFGLYWSSSLSADYGDNYAYYLGFLNGYVNWNYYSSRYYGLSDRGVLAE